MKRFVKSGLCLAVLAATIGIGAPARAAPDANLRVTRESKDLVCPQSSFCFKVKSEKNLTHIFVNVDFGQCGEHAYQILVDGEEVPQSKLHNKGGPCNHSPNLIERDVWFPLTRLQKEAQVCVVIDGGVPAKVSVGAKSSNECEAADQRAPYCSDCSRVCPKPPKPVCPPPTPY